MDINLRELVQWEVLLRAEHERLAPLLNPNKVELYITHRELVSTHEDYWRLEREYRNLEANCPSQPAKRASLPSDQGKAGTCSMPGYARTVRIEAVVVGGIVDVVRNRQR